MSVVCGALLLSSRLRLRARAALLPPHPAAAVCAAMPLRWRRCIPAAGAAAVLLPVHASSAMPSVYAPFSSSSILQTNERCYMQPLLPQHQHPTCFFVSVPSSPPCTRRSTGQHDFLPRKPQYADAPPAATATPAATQSSASQGTGAFAAARTAREQKAARCTAAAAQGTAAHAFAIGHFSTAVPHPALAAAATQSPAAWLTAPVRAALPAAAARYHRSGSRLLTWRPAATELLNGYIASHISQDAADPLALKAADTRAVAAAEELAPRTVAAGEGGAGGGVVATARHDGIRDGSGVVRRAPPLISEQRRAAGTDVLPAASADKATATRGREEELQRRQDVEGRPAAADAAEKPHYTTSTCGVPVGSVAALQEYARRLGISLLGDDGVEVASSSASHRAEDREQSRQLEPQAREEERQRKQRSKPQKRGTPEAAGERWKEKLQQRDEELQQVEDPMGCRREHGRQQLRCSEPQQLRKRRVVVLGSTGSIGRSTLQVVEAFPERFEVVGLAAAGTDLPLLLSQIRRHRPQYVAVGDAATAVKLRKLLLSPAVLRRAAPAADASSIPAGATPAAAVATADGAATCAPAAAGAAAADVISTAPAAACSPSAAATATRISPAAYAPPPATPASAAVPPGVAAGCSLPEIFYGDEGLVEMAALDVYDVLVSAVVGFAGLQPTLKALMTGKDVALANKEALVAAGDVFRNLYEKCSRRLQGRPRQLQPCSPKPIGINNVAGARASASDATGTAAGSSGFPACATSSFLSRPSCSSTSLPLYPSLSTSFSSRIRQQQQQQKRLGVLLPVDSEHSAIFQALQGVAPTNYPPKRLLLVATGGPFRGRKRADLQHVTLTEVLKHPRWSMGSKISVDSATLMNKGLEVIEAHYAFGCPYTSIEVLVHPQAVVHSAVELCDGAVLAQLGTADMKLPIAYALTWPERLGTPWPRLDLIQEGVLTFEKPDLDTFGCLRIAYEAGMQGGLAPACLNAANEIAVSRLLEKKLAFLQIEELVRHVLRAYDSYEGKRPAPDAITLQPVAVETGGRDAYTQLTIRFLHQHDVVEADTWARRIAREWKA